VIGGGTANEIPFFANIKYREKPPLHQRIYWLALVGSRGEDMSNSVNDVDNLMRRLRPYTRKRDRTITPTHYSDLTLAIYNCIKNKPGTLNAIAKRLNVYEGTMQSRLSNMDKRGLYLCEGPGGVLSVMEAVTHGNI
jgi:hypothetical protein